MEPYDVKAAEQRNADLKCEAIGTPKPEYTWIDWTGTDVTRKEGLFNNVTLRHFIILYFVQAGNWIKQLEHY